MNLLPTALFLAVAVTLETASDYHFLTGSPPYSISGNVTTNGAPRGENLAFLLESAYERADALGRKNTSGLGAPATNDYGEARHPFPGLFPLAEYHGVNDAFHGMWFLRVAGGSYGNVSMSTNGMDGLFVYDPSLLAGSCLSVGGTATNGTDEILASMFQDRVPPYSRKFAYRMRAGDTNSEDSVLFISGSEIARMFDDFQDNDAAAFRQSAVSMTNVVATSEYSYTIFDPGYYTDDGSGNYAWTTNSTEYAPSPTVETVPAGPQTYQPLYWDRYTVEKTTVDAFKASNLVSTAYGNMKTSSEYYDVPQELVLWFSPALSNRIVSVDAYGLYTLYSIWQDTVSNRTVTTVLRDDWVLNPISSSQISDAENGGPRWSLALSWPQTAHNIAQAMGERLPGEMSSQVESRLDYPAGDPNMTGVGDSTNTVYVTVRGRVESSRFLRVWLRDIVGVVRFGFRAKRRDH